LQQINAAIRLELDISGDMINQGNIRDYLSISPPTIENVIRVGIGIDQAL